MTHTIVQEDIDNGFEVVVEGCDVNHTVAAKSGDQVVWGYYTAPVAACIEQDITNGVQLTRVAPIWTRQQAEADGSPLADFDIIWQDNDEAPIEDVYEFNYNSLRAAMPLQYGDRDKIEYYVQPEADDTNFKKERGVNMVPYKATLPSCSQVGDKIQALATFDGQTSSLSVILTAEDITNGFVYIKTVPQVYGRATRNDNGVAIARVENSIVYAVNGGGTYTIGEIKYNLIDTTIEGYPSGSDINSGNTNYQSGIGQGFAVNNSVQGPDSNPATRRTLSIDETAISVIDVTVTAKIKAFGSADLINDLASGIQRSESLDDKIIERVIDTNTEKVFKYRFTADDFSAGTYGSDYPNKSIFQIFAKRNDQYDTYARIVEPDDSYLHSVAPVFRQTITTSDILLGSAVDNMRNTTDIILAGSGSEITSIQSSNPWIDSRLVYRTAAGRNFDPIRYDTYGFSSHIRVFSKYPKE